VLTISITDILLADEQQKKLHFNTIQQRLAQLTDLLGVRVPVYCLITKCDKLAGFNEYFSDLAPADTKQVWGMTFTRSIANTGELLAAIRREYDNLLKRIEQRLLWRLNATESISQTELIASFPAQMEAVKPELIQFFQALFGGDFEHHSVLIRGIYFTSALQQDKTINYQLEQRARQAGITLPANETKLVLHKSYFIHDVFKNIIFPEAANVKLNPTAAKKRFTAIVVGFLATALVTCAALVYLVVGYQKNVADIQYTKQRLVRYQQLSKELPGPASDILATLPALNTLYGIVQRYDTDNRDYQWPLKFYQRSVLMQDSQQAFYAALNGLFLTHIKAHLENLLQQQQTNPELLPQIYKAYLVLADLPEIPDDLLRIALEQEWHPLFYSQPAIYQNLQTYLNLLLSQPIVTLPLDWNLIRQTQVTLGKIVPEQSVYQHLLAKAEQPDYRSLLIPQSTKEQPGLFSTTLVSIPFLYTAEGYRAVFLPSLRPFSETAIQDNFLVKQQPLNSINKTLSASLVANLEKAVGTLYLRDYLNYWYRLVGGILFEKPTSLARSAKLIQLITQAQSPLVNLLKLVDNNIQVIENLSTNYSLTDNQRTQLSYLQAFATAAGGADNKSPMQQVNSAMSQLYDYLITIVTAPVPTQAAFTAAQTCFANSKPCIFDNVYRSLAIAPEPLRSQLTLLVDHTFALLLTSARDYLNSLWRTQLLVDYQQFLMLFYPFNPASQQDIPFERFGEFFKPGGRLDSFFQTYLKPFVNTQTLPWRWRTVNGVSFAEDDKILRFFMQAAAIRDFYFATGTAQPALQLTVQPYLLDSKSRYVELALGENLIRYAHGPIQATLVNWPLPANQQTSGISLYNFGAEQPLQLSFTGPWSWFRLLDVAKLEPMGDQNQLKIVFNLQNYQASFIVRVVNQSNLANLYALQKLNWPTAI
jgi:type VI secretion system protein ImpL